MKITIHRGVNQIGGCITEIATDNAKIIIDLGHNLPNGEQEAYDKYATKDAIAKLTQKCNAIFYTHYHGDHVDLFPYVSSEELKQYIGKGAKEVMYCKYEMLRKKEELALIKSFETYDIAKKIYINDLVITPYFVSHSAFDSYMFLIEADGKRILHTGDFRGHGYLSKGLHPVLQNVVGIVDILITEGTMLNRAGRMATPEQDIQSMAFHWMKKYMNVFVLCSSTDMERLASFHAANKRNRGRPFVCDGYQAKVLQIFSKYASEKHSLFDFSDTYIFNFNNQKLLSWMSDRGFCMPIRLSSLRLVKALLKKFGQDKTLLIYSTWDGYYKDESKPYFNAEYKNFRGFFTNCEDIHTSGHADFNTLVGVCNAVSPRLAIIPIHKDKHSDFSILEISEELKAKVVYETVQIEDVTIEIKQDE